jgi:hypothetical protein
MDTVIEWAPFRLKPDASEAELLAAAAGIEREFLAGRPGFIRRELARHGQGYVDLVWWRSRAQAEAAMAEAQTSEACGRYFSLMAFDADDPDAGVMHLDRLHASDAPTG